MKIIRILNIELYKLVHSKVFWAFSLFYFLLVLIIGYYLSNSELEIRGNKMSLYQLGIFDFPDIWQNITFGFSYLKFIFIILVISFTSSEFSNSTIKQNLIDGYSRLEFLTGKFLMSLLIALFSTILMGLIIVFLGTRNTLVNTYDGIVYGMEFLGTFFLNTFAYLSLSVYIGVLIRRTSLGLLILFLFFVCENIIQFFIPKYIAKFFPFELFSRLIPEPISKIASIVGLNFSKTNSVINPEDLYLTSAWILMFFILAYVRLKSSDL